MVRCIFPVHDHCIETAAKMEFRDLMDQLFQGEGGGELEEQVDLLSEFLSRADFSALRAASPRLAGLGECTVAIERKGQGLVVRIMDSGETFDV